MTYTILNMHPQAMPTTHRAATEAEVTEIVRNLWADADYTVENLPHQGVKFLRRDGKPALAVFGGIKL